MSWELAKRAIVTWIRTTSGVVTKWSDQSHEQPRRPYIDLNVTSLTKPMPDIERNQTEQSTRSVFGTRDFVIALRYFKDATAAGDVMDDLENILTTLTFSSVNATLRASDVVFVGTGPVMDTTFLEDSHNVQRADSTIRFRTSVRIDITNAASATIENVVVEPDFEPEILVSDITITS